MPGGAFESDSRLQKSNKFWDKTSIAMNNTECEKKEYRDETGFSEKQLDIAIETGVFSKRKIKKILFEKKSKK